MDDSHKKLIQLIDVDFYYGRDIILEKLNLSIYSSELILLLGENGSGKTTLLKILAGVLSPLRGEVQRDQSFKVNLHLPQTSFYPELTLKQNYDFFSKLYQTNEKYILDLIDLFEIGSFLNKPVEELSFGQKIRGDLVRTFMRQSQLYILDEPFTGLDLNSQGILKNYMKCLLDEGISIIMSSHQKNVMDEFNPRVIHLES